MFIERVEVIAIPGLITNCYILADEITREAMVIDPGGSPDDVLRRIDALDIAVKLIVNTHGHFDHIGANQAVSEAAGAPIAAHKDDVPMYRMKGGAHFFGLSFPDQAEPTLLLDDGEEISLGKEHFIVLHTPGHSPGSICLWNPTRGVVFDGDLVFRAGIGRTDIPGGDTPALKKSIREKILTLPDETILYPGHGPQTTVAQERDFLTRFCP